MATYKSPLLIGLIGLVSACAGNTETDTKTPKPSPLNDTGILKCADATQAAELDCSSEHFEQDGAVGRDAQAQAGTLDKTGSGFAGFDLTRLDANGQPVDTNLSDAEQQAATHCLQDNVTGLMWEVKSDDPNAVNYADHSYLWDLDGTTNEGNMGSCIGLSECTLSAYRNQQNNEQLCGFNDWRLPSVQELSSIAVMSRVNPAVDTDYFQSLDQVRFFTREKRIEPPENFGAPAAAWYVYFSDAGVSSTETFSASGARLVRGHNVVSTIGCDETSDLLETTEKTVIDNRTGLEWQRCSADAPDCTAIDSQEKMTWMGALEFAQNSTYAGYSDWRLPNKNELETLVARDCLNPAIIGNAFPSTLNDRHWTSTPNQFNSTFAWTVSFDKGDHAISPKGNLLGFRMVREIR